MEEEQRQFDTQQKTPTYHAKQLAQSLKGLQERAVSNIKDTYNTTIKKNTQDAFEKFGSNRYVSGTSQFLRSNSLISKFSFLFLVILGFILLLRLGTYFLTLWLGISDDITLFSGMKDANTLVVINQNPNLKGSKPVKRSKNKEDGIEFTYSTWLYIKNIDTTTHKYHHVFHKGNTDIQHSGQYKGMIQPNNAPGVYLKYEEQQCNLYVVMNTYSNMNEFIKVKDIPLNKWIYVVIRVDGSYLDVYINGTLSKRHTFKDVPKQNYGNIYINLNNGFDGHLSELKYYSKSLTIREIREKLFNGPNLKASSKDIQVNPPYFNIKWFFNQ